MNSHAKSFLVRDLLSDQIWDLEFSGSILTSKNPAASTVGQAPDLILCPLLGDPQINGGLGYSFGQPGGHPQPWQTLAKTLLKRGIGWFLPTLITDSLVNLRNAFSQLETMRQEDPFLKAICPGYHLEGPWISPEEGYRGAHPKNCVISPRWDDFERLQDAADGGIVLVTIAPEVSGAIPMISRLVEAGIRVAIGHTQATSETIRRAVEAGATLSTHLGNGIARMIPRHENPLWPQLAHPGLIPSFIPDGHHLPVEFVQTVLAAKGISRAMVTADSSPIAGLPEGLYPLWNTEVEISPEGRVSIPGSGLLAGSGCFTDECLRWLLANVGLNLKEAVPLCGIQAAKSLGINPNGMDDGKSFALVNLRTPRPWEVALVVFNERVV